MPPKPFADLLDHPAAVKGAAEFMPEILAAQKESDVYCDIASYSGGLVRLITSS